jgi:hypothetical protein
MTSRWLGSSLSWAEAKTFLSIIRKFFLSSRKFVCSGSRTSNGAAIFQTASSGSKRLHGEVHFSKRSLIVKKLLKILALALLLATSFATSVPADNGPEPWPDCPPCGIV